jgi:hypothetical protein
VYFRWELLTNLEETRCSPIEVYWRFVGTYCLYPQGRRIRWNRWGWKRYDLPIRRKNSTRLHGVIFQKIIIIIIMSWKPQIPRLTDNYYYRFTVFFTFPSSGILETRKHDVSETGSLSVLRWEGEKTPTQLGPLERANLKHWVGVFLHLRT